MLARRPFLCVCPLGLACALATLAALVACSESSEPTKAPIEHIALHSGTLFHFDDHKVHLELVLNKEIGEMTVYVLGPEAHNPLRPAEAEIQMRIQMPGLPGDQPFDFTIPLTRDDGTGVYVGQSTLLESAHEFTATIAALTIADRTFKSLKIDFPRGNEF